MTELTVVDYQGNIKSLPEADARAQVSDPKSGVSLAAKEDVSAWEQSQRFGGPVQQAITSIEGAMGASTFGATEPLLEKGLNYVQPGLGTKYRSAAKARTEENPGAKLTGELPAYAFGPATKITGAVAKTVLGPIVGAAADSAIVRIAQKTIIGAGEGALFGAANEIIPKTIEGTLYSADAIIDGIVKDSLNFGIMHGVMAAGGEALKSVKEVKTNAKVNLNKITGTKPDVKSGPVQFEALKREESPTGKRGTKFKVNSDGNTEINPADPTTTLDNTTYTHVDGNNHTKIDKGNIAGNGADFTTAEGLNDIGDKVGVEDVPIKYKNLKIEGEKEADFLHRQKINQIREDFVNRNEVALNQTERDILNAHDNAKQDLRLNPDNTSAANTLKQTTEQVNEISNNLKSKHPESAKALNDNLVKNELNQMLYEAKMSEQGQRSGFEGGVDEFGNKININTSSQSTFPDWYAEAKVKNKAHLEKVIASGKGPVYDRLVEIAKGRLENGYENIHSGSNMPHPDYISNLEANRVPDAESKLLDSKIANSKSQIVAFTDNLDHARIGNDLYIYNPEVVSGDLTRVKTQLSESGKEIADKFKVGETGEAGVIKNQRTATFNKVSDYIKNELSPKAGDFAQGEHEIDFIQNKNTANLGKYGQVLEDTVNTAINRLESTGKGTTLTHADIAKFVENEVMDAFRDPKTGNPKAALANEFKQLQQFANDFKQNGFTVDKYGNRTYHPISMQELRQLRIDIDKKANWKSGEAGIVPEGARQLRDYIENHIISKIGENDPGLKKSYLEAKNNVHMALQADAIIGHATTKAIKGATEGKKSVLGAIICGNIGGLIGGDFGRLIGAYFGGGGKAIGILNGFNTAIRNVMSSHIAEAIVKYEGSIKRAASGSISANPSVYPESSTTHKTYSDIKKEEEKLTQAKNNKEAYFDSFISRNSGLFQLAPSTMNSTVSTAIMANEFLLSKVPQNPYKNIPWRADKWEPSQMEVQKYYRFKEAVQKPSVILTQIQNGYVTPEAIEVLNVVYPQTKAEIGNKIMSSIKGEIPQEKRTMLFKVFGIPLDTYSAGPLFAQMQGVSGQSVINQQNEQKAMPNSLKIKPLDGTIGSETQRKQD